ncbi:alpha-amylase family protein [Mucilaginibacter paludis]|uniref:Alpha amylase catalytic region n=1 Tax=Mucilaginibacter paludis DSM 18603 TaxID=714943 RepID=H1Y563_9SPHI|nr:alpha-amylase family protein [Mucilaginibacter paludis]EHQ28606.1 alpha amylase catalytic region [Mucilaginibacter paludis DSM 18603]
MADTGINHKLIIYQLLPRLFGNTNTTNKNYGSVEENGVGKLNDINDTALREIKSMGFTHVWYTGVIEHATMTDYTQYGIPNDDPDVVKGRAGSPYAIKDYYDVAPDLAVDVPNRMAEFDALVQRTHAQQLKVIIDLVPNHVARTYRSDTKPAAIRDFGADDDTTKAFSALNDFYYTPGYPFKVPAGYNPGGDEFHSPLKDGRFDENPAKATGNDVFNAAPSINDWFETVKLNYGVDYMGGRAQHFNPIPPMWQKIYDILDYWSAKGVDGFRCDMVEMVPVEFWGWVIPKIKTKYPQLIFLGEAYNTSQYHNYIFNGGFDYLYDKVGLYDGLKRLMRNEPHATIWDINKVCFHESAEFPQHMLRFLENHDEERIASPHFVGNAWLAAAAMIVTATLSTGPVMIYFGQEVGEPAAGAKGFSEDNGRTTIFDYWGVPEHQKWLNGGQFDGGQLSESQKQLREFYSKLLNISGSNAAITQGRFYELMLINLRPGSGFDERTYAYLRYTDQQRILVVANFDRHDRNLLVKLPPELLAQWQLTGTLAFTDLLSGAVYTAANIDAGLSIKFSAANGLLLSF